MVFRNPYVKGDDTEPLVDKLAKSRRFADDVINEVNPSAGVVLPCNYAPR